MIDSIKEYLESVSNETNIPIDNLIVGVVCKDVYVWDYNSGRHHSEHFKVVSINGTTLTK